MIMFYFLSLDKPEFTEHAKKLSTKTDRKSCFNMAWWMILGNCRNSNIKSKNIQSQKLIKFLREYCERNNWDLTEWLKIQSKVSNHLKTTEFLNGFDFKPNNSHKVISLYDNDDPG